MKRSVLRMLLAVIVLGIIVSFAARPAQEPVAFYYAFSEKIPLVRVPNKVTLRYANAPVQEQATAKLRGMAATARVKWHDARTATITTATAAELSNLLQAGKEQVDVITSSPVYALAAAPKGEMVVTDEFAVKFRSVASADQVAALAKKTRSKVKWTVSGLSVLTVPKGSDALAIANLYQESGLVEFAHPNFLEEIVLHQTAFPIYPNDEFFGRQFYLYNTGQVIADGHTGTRGADIKAPEAWAVTKGNACITIAVLDNGVSANHPDLPNARQIRLNGSNFADGDPNDPSPRGTRAHGNECAGIIAATQGNGEGISGVAPNCKIMPIRIFNTNDSGIPAADLARAILFAKNNGADIISSSWGYGTTTNPNHIPAIVDAIGQSTATGRNGKGCIVAFSSGNDKVVAFPSSVTISGVLTVGASDRNDYKAVYSATSNPGSGDNQLIDIVALSHRAYPNQIADETFEVWTMDTEDANGTGDNPWPSKPRG